MFICKLSNKACAEWGMYDNLSVGGDKSSVVNYY